MPVKDVYPATKKNGDPHPAAGLPKYKYTAKGEERVLKKRDTYKYAKKEALDSKGKLQSRLGLEVSDTAGNAESVLAAGAKLTGGTYKKTETGFESHGPLELDLIQAGRASNILISKEHPSESRDGFKYTLNHDQDAKTQFNLITQTAGLKKDHRKKLAEFIADNQDIFTKRGFLRKNKYVKKNTDAQDAAVADFMGQIESSNIFMKPTGLVGQSFTDEGVPGLGRAGGVGVGWEYGKTYGDAEAQIVGYTDPKRHERAVKRYEGQRGFKEGDWRAADPTFDYAYEEGAWHRRPRNTGPIEGGRQLPEEGSVYDATQELLNQPVIIKRSGHQNQVIMPSFVKAGKSAKNADILLSELTQN